MVKKQWLACILLSTVFLPFSLRAQVVYHDVFRSTVYEFLDEMVNLQLIELNTLAKPYSRELIAEKLNAIDTSKLNSRQTNELKFFLKDFNKETDRSGEFEKRKDLFYYTDSTFLLTVNPIVGGQFWSNKNGNNWRRWWGGELFGYLGDHWGIYASLRDNLEDEFLQSESYLNRGIGANYKGNGDFSEFKGGITYSGKYATVGLIKDKFSWGNHNFGSNIFSTKVPSFVRLDFKVKPVGWLELRYYHGWLNSEVIDSTRSYNAGVRERNVFVSKFIAANFLTIKPFSKFYISLGNSIVYSDQFQPAFLIPFAFFKSLDHGLYSGGGNFGGQNTQVFFDISSRNIKGLHLYTSVFIDEISFSRLWSSNRHSNFISGKFGLEFSNILDKNISLLAEYTVTNPITYKHFVNTTTFESNGYNLGHYLLDNAQEVALGLQFKPKPRLNFDATYISAIKGPQYFYSGTGTQVWGLPFLSSKVWGKNSYQLGVQYELINDLIININYSYQEVTGAAQVFYTNRLFRGNTQTISGKLSFGF